MRSSSRTRSSSRPRSAQLTVTWRIISSKHWAYSSSRTGQMPVSRAWRASSLWSRCSCVLITSRRVAGVADTYCTHNCPSSVHSRGGRIELRMSSVCVTCALPSTGGSFFPPLPGLGGRLSLVVRSEGVSYLTSEFRFGPPPMAIRQRREREREREAAADTAPSAESLSCASLLSHGPPESSGARQACRTHISSNTSSSATLGLASRACCSSSRTRGSNRYMI
mmetsp:Transcript_88241/g.121810  ORF Transcript_88241/g.121810 Transcript_88241/m.121810 type:complete len:223 (+) Transcript_88241:664-1332(+)